MPFLKQSFTINRVSLAATRKHRQHPGRPMSLLPPWSLSRWTWKKRMPWWRPYRDCTGTWSSIQAVFLNLHGQTWNSQVVQQLARGKKLQTRLKTKCPSSNRSQTTRRTSSWPPSISRIDHYASNWWHFLAWSSFFKKKSNFDTWKILENKALMNKNFLDLEWTVVRNGGNRQLSSNIHRFQHSLLL